MFDVSPLQPGASVLIRTVTMYQVGRVVAADAEWCQLEDASWVANTGRLAPALTSGKLAEVEKMGTCHVHIPSIVDVMPWQHDLP